MDPIDVPDDVRSLVREIFADCNHRVSEKLTRIPNLHETSLDHSFIEHFTHHCRPVKTPSEWLMRIDCHFIGGGRHYMRWEIADFGILVVFRHRGRVVRTKVTLLQSKRLYPVENHAIETNPLDVDLGFNFLFMDEQRWSELSAEREFRFDHRCLYRSLQIADEQYEHIADYETRHRIPVHYLFYNPLDIPWSVSFPISGDQTVPKKCIVGSRVVPSVTFRKMIAANRIERPPSYGEISTMLEPPFDNGKSRGGWKLEDYVVDQLIACKDGLIDDTPRFRHLNHIFSQKTQPIHAAIAITFDMPNAP